MTNQHRQFSLIILFSMMVFHQRALAQNDGDLDLNFGDQGKVIIDLPGAFRINDAVLTANGGMIAVGEITQSGHDDKDALVAYIDAQGALTDYKILDISNNENVAKSCVLQQDGKLLIGGWYFNGSNFDMLVTRLNANGSIDTEFGDNGNFIFNLGSTEFCLTVGLTKEGKIILAGRRYNGDSDVALIRLNDDGSKDTGFGVDGLATQDFSHGNDIPYAMIILADGSIVVGGDADEQGTSGFFAAKFTSSGSVDTQFGQNGFVVKIQGESNNSMISLAKCSNGDIALGGYCTVGQKVQFAIWRLGSDGVPNINFGSNGSVLADIKTSDDYLYTLFSQNNGKLLAGGVVRDDGNDAEFGIIRYDEAGTVDQSFGNLGQVTTDFSEGNDELIKLLPSGSGSLIGIGFNNVGGKNGIVIAKYYLNNVASSIKELQGDIHIYPNPFASAFMIECNYHLYSGSDIEVFDMLGRKVEATITALSSNLLSVKPATKGPNIYYVSIKSIRGKETFKLAKY